MPGMGQPLTRRAITPAVVGASVNVVADMQQQGGGNRSVAQIFGYQRMQTGQLPSTAVDVTNGVDTAAGRQRGGRGR